MTRYSEMRNAAEERGTYMDQLNDQLNAASVSASNYLQQARNQAVSRPLRLLPFSCRANLAFAEYLVRYVRGGNAQAEHEPGGVMRASADRSDEGSGQGHYQGRIRQAALGGGCKGAYSPDAQQRRGGITALWVMMRYILRLYISRRLHGN
jgi:hypothetical protein